MNSKEITTQIVQWLINYSEKSKTSGYVVGVSGGIDSALTSTLCAMTGLPTLCLDMPISQNKNEQKRGLNHISWLKLYYDNVKTETVDLSRTFESFKITAEKKCDKNLLALANSRSRLRMATLYYFSTINNHLVVGTGNKVEDFGVGFYTKYGDGGVDISPIADLYKTEIFEISSHLGINKDIIDAKPTDGLWDDGRTDEDQIGATYKELEWAMKQKDNGKISTDFEGREKEVFLILEQFNNANIHKIQPIPVFLIPEKLRQDSV
tara:strand:- start:1890 stop:2684 length:795 start_codon:yes stop_codon:yes gene_type:complete